MLSWPFAFLVIALITALLRVNGLAEPANGIADSVILISMALCCALFKGRNKKGRHGNLIRKDSTKNKLI